MARQIEPPQMLKDMRAVYKQAEADDQGEGQKLLRNMLKGEGPKFLLLMHKLENEHRRAVLHHKAQAAERRKAREPAKAECAPDETTAKLIEMIDNLLDEWPEEAAK